MSRFWLLYIIIRIIMGAASMCTNLFTLVCVVRKKYLRSSANMLVASLALSDFLHGVLTGIILPTRYFSTSWKYSHPLCYAGICIEVTTVLCQYVSFSMLAFERRNSLLFQLNRSKKWSTKVILIILAIMWVLIAVYNVTVTMLTPEVPEGTVCNVVNYYPAFFTYIGVLVFLVSAIMITVAYGHIAWVAHKSQIQVTSAETAMQQMNRKKDMSITKMMAMVVGVFFAVYFPFFVTTVTLSPTSPKWHQVLFNVTILIYDINFWINPFIFAWRDKGFRKAFRETLPRCCTRCFGGTQQAGVAPAPIALLQIPMGAAAVWGAVASGSGGPSAPSMTERTTFQRLTPLIPRDP